MSFALQATYPGVCFSKNALSPKTKFEITSSSVSIRDPTDGYSYTLEEVGRIFKVTRERVRQIEAKAVAKLQNPVRAKMLEGFLKQVA